MDIIDLAPYVEQYVTGCPDPVMLEALRQVAREFSEYTRDYRADLSIAMLADTATYDLSEEVPEGALFLRVERVVNQDGMPIRPFRKSEFDDNNPGWEKETGLSVYLYTMNGTETMRVWPIPGGESTMQVDGSGNMTVVPPEIDDVLAVTVSMKPSLVATTILDDFANRHAEYLGYGAAGLLMKRPGKPWTNVEAGVHYYSLFQERMSKVRSQNLRDHTTAATFISGTCLDNY